MNHLSKSNKSKHTLLHLLRPYTGLIGILLFIALLSNGFNLVIPKIIQNGIDDYSAGTFNLKKIITWFALAAGGIFILSYAQSLLQAFISEKAARDIRAKLIRKIAQQDYNYIQRQTTAKLLTNITSDTDAVKIFISQVAVNLISSAVLIVGSAILLININLKLGLIVLTIVPIIIIAFFTVFSRIRGLFKRTQEVMDWLNRVITESILGAALIRVLNAQYAEVSKFTQASGEAKNLGLSIVALFSLLVPIVGFTASLAQLAVLGVGGKFIIDNSMTIGEFAAFNSYIAILIFPILIIGFTSNMIARAAASHKRVQKVLDEDIEEQSGSLKKEITGNIKVSNVSLEINGRRILKNISFEAQAHSRTAILGPTAAGKSQLLNVLTGLIQPTAGHVYFDGIDRNELDQGHLLSQLGIVFQDSILFNLSLKENIGFSDQLSEATLKKAIRTAELEDFIHTLPNGLNTIVSERGSSLSGGQKQRIMLARALAIHPTILLLDDFTARVDITTEKRIGNNLKKEYPNVTLLSITQKIDPIKDYENIILLMEGEIVAQGKHEELMLTSPEYVQIYQSQQSLKDIETEYRK